MKKQLIIREMTVLFSMIFLMGITHVEAQSVGEAAPDFEVNLLDGGTFILSEQKGKVVFLFFFGNTCPSCMAVGPTLETSVYQEFMDEDFVALGLDTWDSSSGISSVTGFKNATGITFPLALKAGSVAAEYQTSYDHLLVIDRDGVLVHKGSNGAANDVDNAINAINESLMVAGIFSSRPIQPEAGQRLRIFPLPASDVVHIESKEALGQIRIYDAAGKLVMVENKDTRQGMLSFALDVHTLDQGLYYYIVQSSGGPASGKLLIQR